jgi:hypothetical protein
VLLGRVVGEGEPLWLPEDTEEVLAYLREKAQLCPGCGQPRENTMDPEAEGQWRSRALRCHACTAKARAAEQFAQAKAPSGLYFTVEPV